MLVFWKDWGIKGIWFGPTLSVAYNTIAYLLIFYCLDWDRLIKEAVTKREQDDKYQAELKAKQQATKETNATDDDY